MSGTCIQATAICFGEPCGLSPYTNNFKKLQQKKVTLPLSSASHFEIQVLKDGFFGSKAAPATNADFAVWYSSREKHAILSSIIIQNKHC
jgi:hypothetical protein